MANIRNRKNIILVIFSIVILLAAIIAFSVSSSENNFHKVANAALEVKEITVTKDKSWGNDRYFNATFGASYVIQVPLQTEELYYDFDADYKEEKDVKLTLGEDPKYPGGKVVLTGTAPIITFRENGRYTFKGHMKVSGEKVNLVPFDLYVEAIDYVTPRVEDGANENFVFENAKIISFPFKVSDYHLRQKKTAHSGINDIVLLRIPLSENIEDFLPKQEDGKVDTSKINSDYLLEQANKNSEKLTIILKNLNLSISSPVQEMEMSFNASENGKYFFFLEDAVGNSVFLDFITVNYAREYQYKDKNYTSMMTVAAEDIQKTSVYSTTVINPLRDSYNRLLYLFFNKDEGYENYDALMSEALIEFSEARKNFSEAKAEFTLEIENKDLLGKNFSISAENLDSKVYKALLGDSVKLKVNVVDIAEEERIKSVGATLDLKDAKKLFRLKLEFTVNGKFVNPLVPVLVSVHFNEEITDVKVGTLGENDALSPEEKSRGKGFVTFEMKNPKGEVLAAASFAKKNKTAFIVMAAVSGFIALAVGVAIAILMLDKKKKAKAKNAAAELSSSEEIKGEEEELISDAKKALPKGNKKK